MKRSDIETVILSYGADWGTSPLGDLQIRPDRKWVVWTVGYRVSCNSEDWGGHVYLDRGAEQPNIFDLRPKDPNLSMLPPWAAFPDYNAMNIGWRMSHGEAYINDWRAWYESLTEKQKDGYQNRFPAPDDERGWSKWFYDFSDET